MKSNPGPPPTKQTAIITCMDARIDVFKMFNLKLGEAHVIRVGGGRAPDALRSLIASEHVLGTDEVRLPSQELRCELIVFPDHGHSSH